MWHSAAYDRLDVTFIRLTARTSVGVPISDLGMNLAGSGAP
jgi:hypothetical protein